MNSAGQGTPITVTVLVALLVCLIPTTIGGLLSAIGIAGMDRMIQANVIAMSAGRLKPPVMRTCCCSTRPARSRLAIGRATAFLPTERVDPKDLADAAQLASLADETPGGRSIVVLAKEKFGFRERQIEELNATFIPFSAQTRMSGVNLDGREIRKGGRMPSTPTFSSGTDSSQNLCARMSS